MIMMNKPISSKLSFCAFFYLFVIVVQTFTPMYGLVPFFRQTWIFLSLSVIVSFLYILDFLRSKPFVFLFVYFLVVLLNAWSGDAYFHNTIRAFMEFFLILVPALMFYYCINRTDGLRFGRWAVISILLIIIIETIASYRLVSDNPSVIRQMISESKDTGLNNSFLYPLYSLGLSNYFLPHAVPMLIPPIVMYIKEKKGQKKIKYFLLVSLIASFFLVWLSGSMLALLLSVFVLVLSLLTTSGKKLFQQRYVIIVALFFLPIVMSDEIKILILDYLAGLFEGNKYFYDKIIEFTESILYGSTVGDMAARENLYVISLTSFFDNFFFGTNNIVGNHSAILDRLSVLGITGILPLLLFCINYFKMVSSKIDSDNKVFFYESVLVGFLMLLTKDMDSWEPFLILFSIMPMAMIILSKKYNGGEILIDSIDSKNNKK